MKAKVTDKHKAAVVIILLIAWVAWAAYWLTSVQAEQKAYHERAIMEFEPIEQQEHDEAFIQSYKDSAAGHTSF